MGRFFKSMKGQLGRDTGRLISNFIFGDRHSAPFRRVDGNSKPSKSAGNRLSAELEEMEELLMQEMELMQANRATEEKISAVLKDQVPDDEKELIKYLTIISAELHGLGWKNEFSEKEKVINGYSDALLARLKTALFVLETSYPSNDKIAFFRSFIKKQTRRKNFKKNIGIIIVSAFFIILAGGLIIAEQFR